MIDTDHQLLFFILRCDAGAMTVYMGTDYDLSGGAITNPFYSMLKAPLDLTWSCYQNEDAACGVCDSCALRLRGFQQADIDDPINYHVKPNYI